MLRLRIMLLVVAAALTTYSALAQEGGGTSCPSWNRYVTDPMVVSDKQEHTSGNHQTSGTFDSDCVYNIQPNTHECAVSCSTTTTGDAFENGTVGGGHWHVAGFEITQGDSSSNGPQVTCGGQVQGAVRSCLTLFPCDVSVSINGSIGGIGGSVSYSNTPLWKGILPYSNTCAARGWIILPPKLTVPQPPCDGEPYEVAPANMLDYGYEYLWSNEACQWGEAQDCFVDGQCAL